ncbi:MAG: tRNA (guanine37-N1)-methyltransferase [Parcubacteria group bacterium Gr01-1014_17]|nr:MAG: tRNA (guanine37-N1)-methyltransferase [Parcubacteria group bacterium Gr01-1014_17]
MTFHIISLFPNAFRSYLGESILKRAIEGIKPRRPKGSESRPEASGKIAVKFYNPRDFAENKWKRIDRKPYGGGPGMVIQAEPVIRAIEKACSNVLKNNRIRKKQKAKIIWLTPNGKQFTNETAIQYAKKYRNIIIICGRYEGIDARVKKIFNVEELSVGPFVLTGGELAAEILIDTIARQVEGVLGDPQSREETRVVASDVYTRPEVFVYKKKKYRVPKILLTGHRARIEEWRQKRQ